MCFPNHESVLKIAANKFCMHVQPKNWILKLFMDQNHDENSKPPLPCHSATQQHESFCQVLNIQPRKIVLLHQNMEAHSEKASQTIFLHAICIFDPLLPFFDMHGLIKKCSKVNFPQQVSFFSCCCKATSC